MKIKANHSLTEKILVITAIALVSFYVVYTLSNSIFMVVTGAIILLIGSFIKDPEKIEEENKVSKLEQLTIFSEEVLEPSIIKAENKKEAVVVPTVIETKKRTRKSKTVIDIENTNSYKFDEIDKKIKKTKNVKA